MLAWPCRLGKRLSSPDILLLSKMAWVLLRTLGWLSAPGPLDGGDDGGERRWMLWADLRAASPANVQLLEMSI